MKVKSTLTVMATAALFSFQRANAQTGSWKLAGNNNLTGTERLGSKNLIPLKVITNNIERMRIDQFGRIGIGTTVPVFNLDVLSTASSTTAYAVRAKGNGQT